MTNSPRKGRGRGIQFLRALLIDAPPTCVPWPLFRDVNGYGRVGLEGKAQWAHAVMCRLAHGDPPTPKHEATHSCGNGKEGCVNPRHLSWGTRSRNQLDRRFHGTKALSGYRSIRRKLMPEDVAAIRSMRGQRTQREIAAQFGIADATVRDIFAGRIHNPKGPDRDWLPPEVDRLREAITRQMTMAEAAVFLGRSKGSVHGKLHKLGLRAFDGRTRRWQVAR